MYEHMPETRLLCCRLRTKLQEIGEIPFFFAMVLQAAAPIDHVSGIKKRLAVDWEV